MKGVPISTYVSDTLPHTFVVRALCGYSQMGMVATPGLEIETRRMLKHVEDCGACHTRWAQLNVPGATLVSTGGDPEAPW